MDKVKRQSLIDQFESAFPEFEKALEQIPQEAWTYKPEPKEWSVHEIIVHLADSETNSYLRARRLIADPGATLMAYDQDHWAEAMDYHSQDWKLALEITRLVRESTHALIKDLPDEIWEHTIVHPESDAPFRFERWLEIYATHPIVHRDQILANLKSWKQAQSSD